VTVTDDETARTDVTSDEIIVREHGVCCRCGQQPAKRRHHRKLVKQGGLDTWDNQVAVCDDCHTLAPDAIHRNPAKSYADGWLVKSWDTPSTVPIANYHGRGRVLLGTDSTISRVAP